MTFKRLIMSFALIAFVGAGAFAQKKATEDAAIYFKDFQKLAQKQDPGAKKNLLSAKDLIDKAAANTETKDDPKTLYYKGMIYFYVSAYAAAKKEPEFAQFDAEKTMDEAMAAFKAHVTNVDKGSKNDKTAEISAMVLQIRFAAFEEGIKKYKKNEYDSAQIYFASCVELFDVINKLDTLAAFNAGLCGELQKKWDVAEKYYKICVDAGYSGADMVVRYSNALMEQNKDDEALKALQTGKARYPKDNALVIQMFNYYLKKGDNGAAEKALNEAIDISPKDPILYFNAGAIYSELKNYDKAEAAYKKAIELEPRYFDAYFNLGAMYYNQGADLYNAIVDIKDNALYDKEKLRADDLFKQSLPYLEKARELNPKDRNNLIMLRTIYGRLGMKEKYAEINDALKN